MTWCGPATTRPIMRSYRFGNAKPPTGWSTWSVRSASRATSWRWAADGGGGWAGGSAAGDPRRPAQECAVTHHAGILILDYGSQFTQLIARRVREAHVYSEIHPASRSLAEIRGWEPPRITLSGGPRP